VLGDIVQPPCTTTPELGGVRFGGGTLPRYDRGTVHISSLTKVGRALDAPTVPLLKQSTSQ
jgi:hypothetical protein